jgi:hypothetical protein
MKRGFCIVSNTIAVLNSYEHILYKNNSEI